MNDKFIDVTKGLGRTWLMLGKLPDGALYVVPSLRFAAVCKHLLHSMDHHRPRGIEYVTPRNHQFFEGACVPAVAVDPAYWEIRREDPRYLQAIVDRLRVCVFHQP